MIETLYAILGILFLILVIGDFGITAFIPTGEGKITEWLSKIISKAFYLLAQNKGDSGILNYMGRTTIFTIVSNWVLMTWAGFSFILLSDSNSIINGSTKQPADVWEKIYYAGFTISTLGVGDFNASTDFWRTVTALMALMGLILITMIISYVVPVISNVISKRALSLSIQTLGENPEQIVINSYSGGGASALDSELSSLSKQVLQFSEQLHAYPILDMMHSTNKQTSTVIQLACLDEAITIMLHVIKNEDSPALLKLQVAQRAITSYLTDARENIEQTDTPPPLPNLEKIRSAIDRDIAFRSVEEIEHRYGQLKQRRALLKGILLSKGWTWNDLETDVYSTDLTAGIKEK